MVLTESRLKEHFQEQGYVIAEGLLDPAEDLQPLIEEYDALLDRLAAEFREAGVLSDAYEGLLFGRRLAAVLNEADGGFYQHFDISLPQSGVSHDTPMSHGPSVFNLLRNPKLLDAVEELIGPEVYSNPVQHVRIKPPERVLPEPQWRSGLMAQTIWHQDQGVVIEEADETDILTVWVPVTDATEENGCLTVVPGSHKRGLNVHCDAKGEGRSGAHEIPDKLVGPSRLPLPMKAGDVLFMSKLTMHASLPNLSDSIRWSLDLRYNPTGQPTGRPWFPGFVARSRSNPDSELRDPEAWAQSWRDARTHLAEMETPKYQRWDSKHPLCA